MTVVDTAKDVKVRNRTFCLSLSRKYDYLSWNYEMCDDASIREFRECVCVCDSRIPALCDLVVFSLDHVHCTYFIGHTVSFLSSRDLTFRLCVLLTVNNF